MKIRRTVRIAAASLVLAVGGCQGAEEAAGPPDAGTRPAPDSVALTHDRFVELIVALRRAEREVEPSDSAGTLFEARRDSILDAVGMTGEDVAAYLEYRAGDIDYLAELWDTINQRLRHALPREGDDEDSSAIPLED